MLISVIQYRRALCLFALFNLQNIGEQWLDCCCCCCCRYIGQWIVTPWMIYTNKSQWRPITNDFILDVMSTKDMLSCTKLKDAYNNVSFLVLDHKIRFLCYFFFLSIRSPKLDTRRGSAMASIHHQTVQAFSRYKFEWNVHRGWVTIIDASRRRVHQSYSTGTRSDQTKPYILSCNVKKKMKFSSPFNCST